MNEKAPVCRKCKSQCKEQVSDPTWFSKRVGDKLVEAICIDCWNKGEKWEKEGNKNELQRG